MQLLPRPVSVKVIWLMAISTHFIDIGVGRAEIFEKLHEDGAYTWVLDHFRNVVRAPGNHMKTAHSAAMDVLPAWQKECRALYPRMEEGRIHCSEHKHGGSCRKQTLQGVGIYNKTALDHNLLMGMLLYTLRAPRKAASTQEAAMNILDTLSTNAVGILAPKTLRVQFENYVGAGYIDVLFLPPGQHCDFREVWLAGAARPEIVEFMNRWNTQRFSHHEASGLKTVCRQFGLDVLPAWALVVGIAALATPQSRFPCLHFIATMILAQLGNLIRFALPALIHKPVATVCAKMSNQEIFDAQTPTKNVASIRVNKDLMIGFLIVCMPFLFVLFGVCFTACAY
jgi:hypothetical protein